MRNEDDDKKQAEQNEGLKAYHQSLRYLKYRARSLAEMRNYLKRKGCSLAIIKSTIQELISIGLINDLEFAERWVENRARFHPKGKYALKMELKQKGIADDIIDAVIKDDDEEKNALAAVLSRLSRWKNTGENELQKKIFNYLRSRGFSSAICVELGAQIINKKIRE